MSRQRGALRSPGQRARKGEEKPFEKTAKLTQGDHSGVQRKKWIKKQQSREKRYSEVGIIRKC